MRSRALRHKSLVLNERLAKQWRKDGEKNAHVLKDVNGFYFIKFNKDRCGRGGFWF